AERRPGVDFLVQGRASSSVLNRHGPRPDGDRFLVLRPWGEVENHLVFLPSRLGGDYMPSDANDPRTGLYLPEPDLAYPGQTMAACGRHLLFAVLNPTPAARLRLDLTAGYKHDGCNLLPPAVA